MHLGAKSGLPVSKEIEAVLQAKASIQAVEAARASALACKRLVWATWGLVTATALLAVLTLILIVVTANNANG